MIHGKDVGTPLRFKHREILQEGTTTATAHRLQGNALITDGPEMKTSGDVTNETCPDSMAETNTRAEVRAENTE